MMKVVKTALPESLYACAVERAAFEGRSTGATTGVPGLIRSALRFYLNKNGYSIKVLNGELVSEEKQDE